MLIHACGDHSHAPSDPRASRSRAVAWGLWGIHTGEGPEGAAGAHKSMERRSQMQRHSVTNELKCSISHSRKLKEDYAQRNSILKDTEINVLGFCARILYPYYRLIHTTH